MMSDRSPPPGLPAARYALDPRTLEMLVCPLTKTRLTYVADRAELVSRAARLAFPIRKGVPILVIEEGRPLTEDELARLA